jgi:opine dehydrogenase
MIGPKKELWIASIPIKEANKVASIVEKLFDIPTKIIPNFLNLTLTPSNQIIHPRKQNKLKD